MKKITMLLMFLAVSFGYCQNAPINFETGGEGADWNWRTFENDDNPTLEIVSIAGEGLNAGGNTTATAAKFTARPGGQLFAGVESAHPSSEPPFSAPSEIGDFVFDDTNNSVTIWVYQVDFASRFALKMVQPGNAAVLETIVVNPSANQWNLLTFDMSPLNGNTYDQIVFFPDYQNRTEDHIVYFDEVTFGVLPPPTCDDGMQNGNETDVDCGGPDCDDCPPLPKPMVSAPDPTPLPSEVINKYSDFYNPGLVDGVQVNNWFGCNVENGISTIIDGVAPQDNIKGYERSILACINWDGPGLVDASAMNYFYVDVWTSDADPTRQTTNLLVKLENQGANLFIQNEFEIVPNVWNRLELDLNDAALGPMSDPNNRAACFQMLLERNAGTDFFIDNVFFSSTGSLGVNEFENVVDFNVYPNPTQNVWNVKTNNQNIDSIQLLDIQGRLVLDITPNTNEALIDGSSLPAGLYFARINTPAGTNSIKLIKQ